MSGKMGYDHRVRGFKSPVELGKVKVREMGNTLLYLIWRPPMCPLARHWPELLVCRYSVGCSREECVKVVHQITCVGVNYIIYVQLFWRHVKKCKETSVSPHEHDTLVSFWCTFYLNPSNKDAFVECKRLFCFLTLSCSLYRSHGYQLQLRSAVMETGSPGTLVEDRSVKWMIFYKDSCLHAALCIPYFLAWSWCWTWHTRKTRETNFSSSNGKIIKCHLIAQLPA